MTIDIFAIGSDGCMLPNMLIEELESNSEKVVKDHFLKHNKKLLEFIKNMSSPDNRLLLMNFSSRQDLYTDMHNCKEDLYGEIYPFHYGIRV